MTPTQKEKCEISIVLKGWTDGDRRSREELLALVYDELRRVAAMYLRRERSGHTLQPTALVHEAYLKLIDISDIDWQDRNHFFAVSANIMRRILVDHARARLASKRGKEIHLVPLEEACDVSNGPDVEILAVEEALNELATFDKLQSTIVELRYFGGLTIDETARVTGISPATVKREWSMAKAWLRRWLN